MNKQIVYGSQGGDVALFKTAMERLCLLVEAAPMALSEVEAFLKRYYQSSAEEIISQDNRFKVVFVKKKAFNGQVVVSTSKENDEDIRRFV